MATREGEKHDAVVIGGGPSGLACAAQLKASGISDVVVLEREQEAGGVPRHCGHWGFGWESHRRLMTGPDYAARLRAEASGIDVRTGHTVISFKTANVMRVHSAASGIVDMEARQVVMATGARESTRAARFIGGTRPTTVMNTGTLQQLVYLKDSAPFERPVIIGAEWVSFSALMTCHHASIRPAAMIAERLEAPTVFRWGARLRYGVPVVLGAKVKAIRGNGKVTGVEIEQRDRTRLIDCDGVIVSGGFVPEDTLLAGVPADLNTAIIKVGNVQGDLKTAGRCVAEAREIAARMAGALKP